MPVIQPTPGYGKTPYTGTKKPACKMRVYRRPGNFMDKEYRDINQMERWRQYYKEQGFRTRRI